MDLLLLKTRENTIRNSVYSKKKVLHFYKWKTRITNFFREKVQILKKKNIFFLIDATFLSLHAVVSKRTAFDAFKISYYFGEELEKCLRRDNINKRMHISTSNFFHSFSRQKKILLHTPNFYFYFLFHIHFYWKILMICL